MDLLVNDGLTPFLFFAALVVGLLLVEIILGMVGLDSSIDTGVDLDADFDFDVDPWIDALALDADAEIDMGGTDVPSASGLGTVLDLLGMRNVPVIVWLAIFSAAFASIGLAGQSILHAITGYMLTAGLSSALVFVPAIVVTRCVSGIVGRLMPRHESTAISERSYGRRRGVVTVGVAWHGSPAQVRFTDTHGNLHYVMVEPFDRKDEIAEGSEVVILKTLRDGLKIIKTSDA